MEIHFLVMENSLKSHGKSLLNKSGHPVDKFLFDQAISCDYKADLHGIGNHSVV